MLIAIRDKHIGSKEEYYDLFELHTDTKNIYMTIENIYGWKKEYIFEKKDYEIAYIG